MAGGLSQSGSRSDAARGRAASLRGMSPDDFLSRHLDAASDPALGFTATWLARLRTWRASPRGRALYRIVALCVLAALIVLIRASA